MSIRYPDPQNPIVFANFYDFESELTIVEPKNDGKYNPMVGTTQGHFSNIKYPR